MSTSPGHASTQSPASRNKRRLAVVLGLSASYVSLDVWTLTSGVNAMSVHVVLVDGADHDTVRRAVRSAVIDPFRIVHVTVQAERGHCDDRGAHA